MIVNEREILQQINVVFPWHTSLQNLNLTLEFQNVVNDTVTHSG